MPKRFDVHVGDKNVAYAEMGEDDPLRIDGLFVSPSYRGKGYASKLLERVEKAHPGKTLTLRARPMKDKPLKKKELIKLYESKGWAHKGDGLMQKKMDLPSGTARRWAKHAEDLRGLPKVANRLDSATQGTGGNLAPSVFWVEQLSEGSRPSGVSARGTSRGPHRPLRRF